MEGEGIAQPLAAARVPLPLAQGAARVALQRRLHFPAARLRLPRLRGRLASSALSYSPLSSSNSSSCSGVPSAGQAGPRLALLLGEQIEVTGLEG